MVATTHNKDKSNPALVEYRLQKVEEGVGNILKKMDEFSYAPLSAVDKLQGEIDSVKKDIEDNYVKKSDGKVIRNIGIAVATSGLVTITTAIILFIINGDLRHG